MIPAPHTTSAAESDGAVLLQDDLGWKEPEKSPSSNILAVGAGTSPSRPHFLKIHFIWP